MGAAAFVAGVLAQLQEFFDIQVPAFQVGAHGALALATLVNRHGGVVDDFQEGHHALALAVGAFDVGTQRTHGRPVVAQAAGPFGEQRVVFDGAVDAFQVILHGGQVAGGQLGMTGAAVEQRRRAGHVIEGRQQVVEFDGPFVRLIFPQRQAHGHAHEEHLGQFQAGAVPVQEVAVVQGLQAEESELVVALGFQGCAQAFQVKGGQGFIQQFVADTGMDEGAQGLWITFCQWLIAG